MTLVEDRSLGHDDGTFLLRALIDLETDGVELFGDARPADGAFYAEVARYLEARVGEQPVRTLALDSALEFREINGGECVKHKFLIHKRGDHVGVAVVDIERGERVVGIHMDDDSTVEIDAVDKVPLGHKIAIAAVTADTRVVEYGAQIGKAPEGFAVGEHVHTHNLRSARW
jgi:(2R)-sulfolactate sulfo-lyase subunit alpha